MSFRAKSKDRQWTLWLCAALVGLAVYVVVARIVFGTVDWNVLAPHRQRLLLPIVLLFWFFAWETRWDGVRRESGTEKGEQEGEEPKLEVGVEERNLASGARSALTSGEDAASPLVGRRNGDATSPSPVQNESCATHYVHSSIATLDLDSSLTGEELYAQARAMKHRTIPDLDMDAAYLSLLSQSAAKGYSPALAKLGEYAMRRRAWVEAYYWMKLAQRNGMHRLSPMLREIRTNWAAAGFPRQTSNVSMIFSSEAGALGRALLRFDSRHEAAKAKEFLMANYPEFL